MLMVVLLLPEGVRELHPPGSPRSCGRASSPALRARQADRVRRFAALSAGCRILFFPRVIKFGQRLGAALVFLLIAAAVVTPWAARNRAQLGELVVSTTHGGITFYESNNHLIYENPEFRGIVVLPRTAVPRWDELKGLGEVELDRAAWQMGLEFVTQNPKLLPRMVWWKFARFWRVRSGLGFGSDRRLGRPRRASSERWRRVLMCSHVYWAAVIPLFALGLVVTWRTPKAAAADLRDRARARRDRAHHSRVAPGQDAGGTRHGHLRGRRCHVVLEQVVRKSLRNDHCRRRNDTR